MVSSEGGKQKGFYCATEFVCVQVSHVHSLSMFVDMQVNILWGKFIKMTSINEKLIKHWSLIFDFILLITFEL